MAQKFRPYLTPTELELIISSLATTNPSTPLIRYLKGYQLKIDNGLLSPQITTAPTLEEKLGLDVPSTGRLSSQAVTKDLATLKLHAYNKWLDNPAKCTIQELDRSMLYRYENDLLTPEEETSYESAQFHQVRG